MPKYLKIEKKINPIKLSGSSKVEKIFMEYFIIEFKNGFYKFLVYYFRKIIKLLNLYSIMKSISCISFYTHNILIWLVSFYVSTECVAS